MNKKALRKIWKWSKIIIAVYLVIGVSLYFLQDKFLFHPKKLPSDYKYSFDIPFQQIDLPVTEKKILSIVKFTVPDSLQKGIVLYFHGNRENINRYAKYANAFIKNGYEVWMMDYPGFGKSTGSRTERIINEDAAQLYKMALHEASLERVIIYGKSLGTGVAAKLASDRGCKRVILETPYYSIAALARHYFFMYPVMTKYYFPTFERLPEINAPITIFHGTKDEVIPYKQAKWLAEENKNVELITIPKGKHNNLPESPLFQHKLDSILSN